MYMCVNKALKTESRAGASTLESNAVLVRPWCLSEGCLYYPYLIL